MPYSYTKGYLVNGGGTYFCKGLMMLTALSTTLQRYIVSTIFISGGSHSNWGQQPNSQVTDKLYHLWLYRVHLAMTGNTS